jgi:hypothetical protein
MTATFWPGQKLFTASEGKKCLSFDLSVNYTIKRLQYITELCIKILQPCAAAEFTKFHTIGKKP